MFEKTSGFLLTFFFCSFSVCVESIFGCMHSGGMHRENLEEIVMRVRRIIRDELGKQAGPPPQSLALFLLSRLRWILSNDSCPHGISLHEKRKGIDRWCLSSFLSFRAFVRISAYPNVCVYVRM